MQIVLFVVAILTIVGAWTGWRRSPLYSARITLKLGAAFVVIVAAVAACTALLTTGAVSRSPELQIAASIVGVLLLSTGGMVLLIRITDAHVAQLPPELKAVTLHRRRVLRWIGRTAAYLLASGGAAAVVPSSWSWLPLMLGGFVLILCGPMLVILYMMARRNDRGLSATMAGAWVHWQFPPVQWQAWARYQFELETAQAGSTQKNLRNMLKLIGLCAALFGVGAWLDSGSVKERLWAFGACLAFVIAAVGIVFLVGRGMPRRHYRRILAASPDAYFGAEGFFCNGEYLPWTLSGQYLLEATVSTADLAQVVLTFESFNGRTSTQLVKRVPIPEGHLQDLSVLQQKLSGACRTAKIRLNPVR